MKGGFGLTKNPTLTQSLNQSRILEGVEVSAREIRERTKISEQEVRHALKVEVGQTVSPVTEIEFDA
jgi:hypothetical protein